jgi:hypothetical protein
MADADEKKKDEGIGVGTMFLVSVLGSLTVIGIVEGVKYMARRQQRPAFSGGFVALPPSDDTAWEFVE